MLPSLIQESMNLHNSESLKRWFTAQQKQFGFKIELLEKGLEEPWVCQQNSAHPLHRTDNAFHRAVVVKISPANSESGKKPWSQFMVEMMDTKDYHGTPINGIILLARTKIDSKKILSRPGQSRRWSA